MLKMGKNLREFWAVLSTLNVMMMLIIMMMVICGCDDNSGNDCYCDSDGDSVAMMTMITISSI